MPKKPAETAVTGPTRDASGRFIRGNNANPGGRPKEYRAFKQTAAEFMDSRGVARLIRMAEMDHFDSLKLLAEYAYGKPTKYVDVTSAGETIKAYVGVELDKV